MLRALALQVYAVEKSVQAAPWARRNVERYSLQSSVQVDTLLSACSHPIMSQPLQRAWHALTWRACASLHLRGFCTLGHGSQGS